MGIAIITGASSGMGKEFVLRLDKEKNYDEIWVIARRKERLEALQADCRAKIVPVPLDLTDAGSFDTVRVLLEEKKPVVDTLVNAAGFGLFGSFTEQPLEELLEMIDLNDKACVAMTHLVLPYMPKGGEIYQLDSRSAFQPVPYIGVYGATKAFVLSFSRALNVELKSRGIKVLAVCPGWVKSEFFDRAVKDDTIQYYDHWFTPEEVITRALRDMKRGKDVSVPGLDIRFWVLVTKLLPHRVVMKIWCKQQKK